MNEGLFSIAKRIVFQIRLLFDLARAMKAIAASGEFSHSLLDQERIDDLVKKTDEALEKIKKDARLIFLDNEMAFDDLQQIALGSLYDILQMMAFENEFYEATDCQWETEDEFVEYFLNEIKENLLSLPDFDPKKYRMPDCAKREFRRLADDQMRRAMK